MGYSTPKKQLDLKEFLAQPVSRPQFRNGMSFRKAAQCATGSTVSAPPQTKTGQPKADAKGA